MHVEYGHSSLRAGKEFRLVWGGFGHTQAALAVLTTRAVTVGDDCGLCSDVSLLERKLRSLTVWRTQAYVELDDRKARGRNP